jgi:phage terminase large subunit-like protein
MSDSACVVTRGSTYDNRRNLSKQFFKSVITKYEGTRIGRQELLAELLEDTPGALWKMAMIDSTRVSLGEVRWDVIIRIVVAVDPAVTHGPDSNETGIVVAGLTRSGHVIIIDDLSCRESPAMWGRIAVNAYLSRRADRIVGEVNNGGDLVEGNIRAANANVAFRAVHASRGKRRRAEPVAALYEQGRVHHVGTFPEMEQQMCAYVPGMELDGASDSPDRMDALVWAVTELVVDPEAASEVLIMQPAGTYQISSI